MSVLVAGDNEFNQISTSSNKTINQPKISDIDFTDIISYSIYKVFSVIVLNSGIPCAIGNNTGWPIHSSLPRFIKKWTSFTIIDDEGQDYFVESAVCGLNYTLYKVRLRSGNSESRLALVQKGKTKGKPIFLNTGNWIPVSIYGGNLISAAIDERGAIHVINNNISNNNYKTNVLFLPNNELPISVCFCEEHIISLSGQKVLYEYHLSDLNNDNDLFNRVQELNGVFINSISGTYNHCVVVSTSGAVFVRGLNKNGEIGLGSEQKKTSKFIQLSSLKNYRIQNAFAGCFHSLFVDVNGVIFSCGINKSGELLTQKKLGNSIYIPIKTQVTSNSKFCVVGSNVSVIFVDNPPLNLPNQTLMLKSPYPYPQLFANNQNDNPDLMRENEKLKKEVNEKNEVNDLLQEIVNTQIEELMKLNKKNEKMKKILELMEIEIDSDDDDESNKNNEETTNSNEVNDSKENYLTKDESNNHTSYDDNKSDKNNDNYDDNKSNDDDKNSDENNNNDNDNDNNENNNENNNNDDFEYDEIDNDDGDDDNNNNKSDGSDDNSNNKSDDDEDDDNDDDKKKNREKNNGAKKNSNDDKVAKDDIDVKNNKEEESKNENKDGIDDYEADDDTENDDDYDDNSDIFKDDFY